MPMIDCTVADGTIGPVSEIPKGCLYLLEHTLVREATEDMVSGWEQEFREQRDEA